MNPTTTIDNGNFQNVHLLQVEGYTGDGCGVLTLAHCDSLTIKTKGKYKSYDYEGKELLVVQEHPGLTKRERETQPHLRNGVGSYCGTRFDELEIHPTSNKGRCLLSKKALKVCQSGELAEWSGHRNFLVTNQEELEKAILETLQMIGVPAEDLAAIKDQLITKLP